MRRLVLGAAGLLALLACLDASLVGTRCDADVNSCGGGLVCCAGECVESGSCALPDGGTPQDGGGDAGDAGGGQDGGGDAGLCPIPEPASLLGPRNGVVVETLVPTPSALEFSWTAYPEDAGAGCEPTYVLELADGCDARDGTESCIALTPSNGYSRKGLSFSHSRPQPGDGPPRRYWRVRTCLGPLTDERCASSAVRYVKWWLDEPSAADGGAALLVGTRSVDGGTPPLVRLTAAPSVPSSEVVPFPLGGSYPSFGRSMAALDFDGDRLTEVFAWAGVGSGASVPIVRFRSDGDAGLVGEQFVVANGSCGRLMKNAGDLDGDGRDDLLVACDQPGIGSSGRVYLARRDGGHVFREFVLTAADGGFRAATRLAALGDLDGDGRDDFGAISGEPGEPRRLSLFLGGGWTRSSAGSPLPASLTYDALEAGRAVGTSLSRLGDVRGDPADELLATDSAGNAVMLDVLADGGLDLAPLPHACDELGFVRRVGQDFPQVGCWRDGGTFYRYEPTGWGAVSQLGFHLNPCGAASSAELVAGVNLDTGQNLPELYFGCPDLLDGDGGLQLRRTSAPNQGFVPAPPGVSGFGLSFSQPW